MMDNRISVRIAPFARRLMKPQQHIAEPELCDFRGTLCFLSVDPVERFVRITWTVLGSDFVADVEHRRKHPLRQVLTTNLSCFSAHAAFL